MTALIYRGVTHNGQKTIRPRVAQDLIYRGVRHDGLSKEKRAPSRTVAMCYRGVPYALEMGGACQETAATAGSNGQIVSKPAFA